MVLVVSEMLNSAIEGVCDLIDMKRNEKVGAIKDVCAGAVLLSLVGLVLVGGWILWASLK